MLILIAVLTLAIAGLIWLFRRPRRPVNRVNIDWDAELDPTSITNLEQQVATGILIGTSVLDEDEDERRRQRAREFAAREEGYTGMISAGGPFVSDNYTTSDSSTQDSDDKFSGFGGGGGFDGAGAGGSFDTGSSDGGSYDSGSCGGSDGGGGDCGGGGD